MTQVFTAEEIEQELKRNRSGVDLHCHLEGILGFEDLREIAFSLGSDCQFREETWDTIANILRPHQEMTLVHFLNKLTGRWIRLLLIKAVLHGGHTFESALPVIIRRVLTKLYDQGLGIVELTVSIMTMTNEGDFFFVPTREDASKEERDLIIEWNQQVREWQQGGVDLKNTLSVDQYLQITHDVITQDQRYCSSKQSRTGEQMQVGIKFMIRREKDTQFRNSSLTLSQELTRIRDLYQKGLIVGVDLAGDELAPSTEVVEFRQFFHSLREIGIPFTIHAGEIPADTAEHKMLASQNLQYAISLGAKRIGHAVRLFDHTDQAITLLREVIEAGIFIEVNITSNVWTGTVPSVENHPIIHALGGDHPLAREDHAILERLCSLVIICDDDPVVAHPSQSIAHEIALICSHTQNLGFSTVDELVAHLFKIGKEATL